jgi:hypothetical protein
VNTLVEVLECRLKKIKTVSKYFVLDYFLKKL